MPTLTPTRSRVRSKLIAAARTGLIPACDDIEDEAQARFNHAAHLIRTMRRIAPCTSHASDERVVTDILADLRYYCARKRLSFEELDAAAALDNDDWQSAHGPS